MHLRDRSGRLMMMKKLAPLLRGTLGIGLLLLLSAGVVRAHDPGLSTGRVEVRPDAVVWEVALAPADADFLLPTAERGADQARVRGLLAPRVGEFMRASEDGVPLVADSTRVEFRESDSVEFHARFPRKPGQRLVLTLPFFPSLPSGHRHYTTVVSADGALLAERLLHTRDNEIALTLPATLPATPPPAAEPPARPAGFGLFLKLGIEHILTGYDHLLFLFGLLVVCTRWQTIAAIVTSFTVGHSLTLIVATLDLVTIRSSVVEPAIAASIVFVGAENLFRGGSEPRGRWIVTFLFGLVHGFGFASVLRDLGVADSPGGLLVPLVSFNLGVEVGQLLVAAAFVPLLQWGKRRNVVSTRAVLALSALVGAAGLYWLLARTILA